MATSVGAVANGIAVLDAAPLLERVESLAVQVDFLSRQLLEERVAFGEQLRMLEGRLENLRLDIATHHHSVRLEANESTQVGQSILSVFTTRPMFPSSTSDFRTVE